MLILKSKWFTALILVSLILTALFIIGHKKVHTELIIPATPAEVWAVLSDAEGFKDWNPVLVPVKGKFIEGIKLTYEMSLQDGSKTVVEASVVKVVKEKRLNQHGGIPGVMTFNHNYILEPAEGGTKVIQHEEYRGIGVPFWNPEWFQSAYKRANEALSKKVLELKKNKIDNNR